MSGGSGHEVGPPTTTHTGTTQARHSPRVHTAVTGEGKPTRPGRPCSLHGQRPRPGTQLHFLISDRMKPRRRGGRTWPGPGAVGGALGSLPQRQRLTVGATWWPVNGGVAGGDGTWLGGSGISRLPVNRSDSRPRPLVSQPEKFVAKLPAFL